MQCIKHLKDSSKNNDAIPLLFWGLLPGLQELSYLQMNSLIPSADIIWIFRKCVVPVAGWLLVIDRWPRAGGQGRAADTAAIHRHRTFFSSLAQYTRAVWIWPPPQHHVQQSCLLLCHRGRQQRWHDVFPFQFPGGLTEQRGKTKTRQTGGLCKRPPSIQNRNQRSSSRAGIVRWRWRDVVGN